MKRLLLIDEEAGMEGSSPYGNYMWYYWKTLVDQGYVVDQSTTCHDALQRLRSGTSEYALAIVDLMMPPAEEQLKGKELRSAADVGRDLIFRIHQTVPALKIVVLTNVCDPSVLAPIEAMAGVVAVYNKPDHTPVQFAANVRRMLHPDESK